MNSLRITDRHKTGPLMLQAFALMCDQKPPPMTFSLNTVTEPNTDSPKIEPNIDDKTPTTEEEKKQDSIDVAEKKSIGSGHFYTHLDGGFTKSLTEEQDIRTVIWILTTYLFEGTMNLVNTRREDKKHGNISIRMTPYHDIDTTTKVGKAGTGSTLLVLNYSIDSTTEDETFHHDFNLILQNKIANAKASAKLGKLCPGTENYKLRIQFKDSNTSLPLWIRQYDGTPYPEHIQQSITLLLSTSYTRLDFANTNGQAPPKCPHCMPTEAHMKGAQAYQYGTKWINPHSKLKGPLSECLIKEEETL
jgi:hypothetical protein